jgi:uncharacterized damage-inducible protein DinB
MSVSADTLRMHLDYTAWASRRVVDAAARLSADELKRDFQTADHNVLGTLVHVFAADRIWLTRVTGASSQSFISDADYSMAVLQNDWPALHEKWRQWAQGITDQSAQAVVAYKDLKGNPYQQPLWRLILHVVNHGSHHRGQVSGFLRAMGQNPPPLDLTAYYREETAHA